MIKNIIFDMDGTLVNCTELQTHILREVFTNFGVDTSSMDLSKLIGPPLSRTFAEYFGVENVEQAFDKYKQLYITTPIHSVYLMPGIRQLLITLRDSGYRLFVTSLQIQSVVQSELQHLDILQYFDRVYGDNIDKPYSSKAEVIADLMSELNIDPAQTVMVGDTDNDLLGGASHGMTTVGVMWGYGKDAFGNIPYTIDTADQLLSILHKL